MLLPFACPRGRSARQSPSPGFIVLQEQDQGMLQFIGLDAVGAAAVLERDLALPSIR